MRLCRAKDVTTYASERIPTNARWHLDADGGGGSWFRFWRREKRSSLVSQPPLPLLLSPPHPVREYWLGIYHATTLRFHARTDESV
jgi:hypothetical protein